MRRRLLSKKKAAILLLVMLSWGNFQVEGLYFFTIFQTLYCILSFANERRSIVFSRSYSINVVFVMMLFTAASAMMTDLPWSFKKYSLLMTVVFIPQYFAYTYLMEDCKQLEGFFGVVMRAIRLGFLVQIIYLPIQYVFYRFLGVDTNRLIFSDLLHLMPNPTFFRQWTYYPSGFVWHSAVLAPMFVLSFLMFDNSMIRLLILMDSFLCGNNTAMIGTILAFICVLLRWMFRLLPRLKRRDLLILAAILPVGILLLFWMDGAAKLAAKVNYLLFRIFSYGSDTSSAAHVGYYLLYPKVLKSERLIPALFGTGYASSGYSITRLNGQYCNLLHWAVESDFIDILISRGLLGFITYYAFLFVIVCKGAKIDYRYAVATLVIVLQGITYNVQFEYLFFIELIMLGSIRLKKNFFTEGAQPKAVV